MLTEQHKSYFDAFGFLFFRELFSPNEMEAITREANELLEADRQGQPLGTKTQHMMPFVELGPRLTQLVEDDRIYRTIEDLLGPDFIWAGSEGNVTVRDVHQWHADHQVGKGYWRIKVMLYLDPTTKDNGALRIIPGSHRMPFHADLDRLQPQKGNTCPNLFGVPGSELPSYPVESQPGDVLFFNQTLCHGVFNGWRGPPRHRPEICRCSVFRHVCATRVVGEQRPTPPPTYGGKAGGTWP